MNLRDEDIELIDRYLDKDLSLQDNRMLEERLADEGFRNEFHFRTSVADSVTKHYTEQLRDDLKKQVAKMVLVEEPKGNQKGMFYWAASVAAVLAVIVLVYNVFRESRDTHEQLFYSFYKPYSVSTLTRGEELRLLPLMENYKNGRYQEAAAALEKISVPTDSSYYFSFQLMLGNCYLNEKKFKDAEKLFGVIRQSNQSLAGQHAEWYLALTFLRQNRIEECRRLLGQIISKKAMYAAQANSLLNRLS
jgi:hypothetical protein